MASNRRESKDIRYDRDTINITPTGEAGHPPQTVYLSQFLSNLTAAEAIQQTADYARDPRTYLEANLGNKVLEDKKDLLCVPDKVDRDIYGVGEHKKHFEHHIATLFGKEHALFFITGIQAQLAAMQVHCDRASKNKVAWHITSHLEGAEEAAYRELYSLDRVLLGSDPDNLPTVEEIKDVLSLPEDDRPAVVLIELPNRELGCQTYSYSDLEVISTACHEADVKFHMDGARIWEIEPYYQHNYGKTFSDIARLFDSLYVSFYKGLRGATGAMMLAPDAAFIDEAKKWQRRAGGTAFQLTYEIIDCQRGYNENTGTFELMWRKMEEVVESVMAATSKFKNDDGQPVVEFWPGQATCCQIRTAFSGFTNDELMAARDKVAEKTNVNIFQRMFKDPRHRRRQIVAGKARPGASEDKTVKAEIPTTVGAEDGSQDDNEKRYMIEWMIVKATLKLETQLFVDAYVMLCEELLASRKR